MKMVSISFIGEEGAFGFTIDLRAASEFVASGNVQAYKLHKAAMEDKTSVE